VAVILMSAVKRRLGSSEKGSERRSGKAKSDEKAQ